MVYWLVSLPVPERGQADDVWSQLQDLSAYRADLSVNFRFGVPEFRVGTLDALLALSDDLVKVNASVEGTVNKARRSLFDLAASAPEGEEPAAVLVEGLTTEAYLQGFSWQEAKYPSRRPLKETLAAITDTVLKLDDDLKLRSSEYSSKRAALQAVLRKAGGALPVRDLSDAVPEASRVETEHLVTVAVVVTKTGAADFLSSYESLTEYVVPRSATLVLEEGDHAAYSLVLFRRILDDFKTAARGKGYVVKDLTPLDAADAAAPAPVAGSAPNGSGPAPPARPTAASAAAELEAARAALEEWTLVAHSEAFSAWVHVLAIRVFVESVLRYGLPPRFLAALLRPHGKAAPKLRKVLADNYSGVGSRFFTGGDAGPGDTADAFPYVSFTLSIEEQS